MNNRKFIRPFIDSMVSVTPKNKLDMSDLYSLFGEDKVKRIVESTGIKRVGVAEEGKTSADYCYEAAIKLFSLTDDKPEEIDGLIFVTETPDYIIPNTSSVLQNRLGIKKNTIVYDLRYGCAGYLYGLFLAALFIESGYCSKVLLLAGDTVTKLLNPRDRALRMVTGDAACASLIKADGKEHLSMFDFFTDGSGLQSIWIPAGGYRTPLRHGVTDILHYDNDGNGHTDENLYMDGMDIMVFAVNEAPRLINNVKELMGWTNEDIDLVAVHQANEMIVNRIAKIAGLPKEKIPVELMETGNCGMVSIPLLLTRRYNGINPSLKKVIACGFGSGLTAASVGLDLSSTRFLGSYEV